MKCKQDTTYVDAKGAICPVPLMLLKKAVDKVSVGEVVEITVTDIHAELDFEIWCEKFGYQLQILVDDGDLWRFRVIKT